MNAYRAPRPVRDKTGLDVAEAALPKDWELLGVRVARYEAGARRIGSPVSIVGNGATPDEALMALAAHLHGLAKEATSG